jgi:hypothetical protein
MKSDARNLGTRAPVWNKRPRSSANRRDEAVIQAELRRLALALRTTATGRLAVSSRNEQPDVYRTV